MSPPNPTCVPCEKKKLLNQQSAEAVQSGEKMRRKVEKAVRKGRITEVEAGQILGPYMEADRDFIFAVKQAEVIAVELYDRLVG